MMEQHMDVYDLTNAFFFFFFLQGLACFCHAGVDILAHWAAHHETNFVLHRIATPTPTCIELRPSVQPENV
ncbi:hypothetical protein B0J12DRAFT_237883 [Macrophomina phaseolina]|uniref:Secreted protein n=1 Tax=Macrophomina phaseolina TaxID=35725 RepID=A0ABQ8GQG6_9PEZI|nr:hypothetical protein B0J12DRAFT_237883 [Macrophomina phaseolina]